MAWMPDLTSVPQEAASVGEAGRPSVASLTSDESGPGAPRCGSSGLPDESPPKFRNQMRALLETFFTFLSPKQRVGSAMRGGWSCS
uniref:Uncharacterized protein n=1 Tax=Setaria viridis TaxID=4556 RepID=A0A4U6VDB1_SETVI|nr:hypothetical protein SEVIR_3G259100v2 [Setaria viridis]